MKIVSICKNLLYTTVLLLFTSANAQEIIVPLTPKVGGRPGSGVMSDGRSGNISMYEGLDMELYTSGHLNLYAFYGTQLVHDLFGLQYLLDNDIDTQFVYQGKLEKNEAAAFVGIDKDGYYHVSIDGNNNKNFSDDKWREIEPNTSDRDAKWVFLADTVTFEYYDGKQVRQKAFPVQIIVQIYPKDYQREPMPFESNNDTISKNFKVYFGKISYKEGKATYKGHPYTFLVSDHHYNVYPGKHSYSLQIDPNPDTTDYGDLYSYYSLSERLVKIDSGLFKIPKEVRDTLILQYVREAKYGKVEVGASMPLVEPENLQSGERQPLINGAEKYTVIDFWGSWCGPCIEALPKLKALQTKYLHDDVQFVSLAFDTTIDKEKLPGLIEQYQLDWTQLYLDMENEGKDYLRTCEIRVFPTTVVVDPRGLVVYKGNSKTSLEDIDRVLENIFKRKD